MSDFKKLKRPVIPPTGLRPRWSLELSRISELKQTIYHYMEANYSVPEEWIQEYNELIEKYTETEIEQI